MIYYYDIDEMSEYHLMEELCILKNEVSTEVKTVVDWWLPFSGFAHNYRIMLLSKNKRRMLLWL